MSKRSLAIAAAGVGGSATDPNFKNVSLLLQGDGTNGAQNNTFLDSSTNNFTITRNGNTTQGTFSPYGNLWSNYFDGSGDYLEIPQNNATAISGDGTIEAWIFLRSYNTTDGYSTSPILCNSNGGSAATVQWSNFGVYGNWSQGSLSLSSRNYEVYSAAGTIPLNQWVHVAAVKSGSTVTLYKDGVSIASGTFNETIFPNTSGWSFRIGHWYYASGPNRYFDGYISNVRIVNGTALYTSNFTPSTTPLTAVSGTSLLTCQSNRFIDNSSNNFTLTVNGDTKVQRFSPFNPTSPYSASTIGGSGYFDGTGDYLLSASTTAMNLGSGNFCLEMWFYANSTSGTYNGLCGSQTDYKGPSISRYNTKLMYGLSSNGTSWNVLAAEGSVGSTTIIAGQWYHLVLCRTGTTISAFLNGQRDITVTSSATLFSRTEGFVVGGWFQNYYIWNGYISNFRFVVGSNPYDATQTTITVPTSPVTSIANTQLLYNFTNAGIPDAAMMNDLETVGNAQVSTSVKKYGTGSLYFDGTGDYLTMPPSPNFAFGTGDFTIEFWAYKTANASGGYDVVCSTGAEDGNGTNGYFVELSSLRGFVMAADSSVIITYAMNPNTSSWQHYAVSRNGSTLRLFVNGSVVASTTSTKNFTSTVSMRVGGTGNVFNGYIDDLRITKGLARYTANFTPPAQSLPTQ